MQTVIIEHLVNNQIIIEEKFISKADDIVSDTDRDLIASEIRRQIYLKVKKKHPEWDCIRTYKTVNYIYSRKLQEKCAR